MAKIIGDFGKGTLLLKEVVWAKPTSPGNVSVPLKGVEIPFRKRPYVGYHFRAGQKKGSWYFLVR